MIATLALAAFERLLNDWIDLDAATRLGFDQLAGHASNPTAKLLRIIIDAPNLSVDVLFDHGRVRLSPTALGQSETPIFSVFEQRPYDKKYSPVHATTTLHVPHLVALAKLIGAKAGSTGNLPIQGDMSLLQALQKIMAQAEPDIAGKLAPLIGDMPAQQIGNLLKQSQDALKQSSKTFIANSEEWVREDSELFAPRWQAEQFSENMQDVQSDVERLQARVARLQAEQTQQ
jgi:ubiquinone biosynthesis protein UbiJ